MTMGRDVQICMVLKNDSEVDLFKNIMQQNKIKNVTCLTSGNIAYETATRKQFGLFIVGIDLGDIPGIVLLQKLRACGNYGLEPYLFVGDGVDKQTVNLFAEHQIEYVITKPYSPEKIVNKLFYIFKQESNLSPQESAYRNAKAALQSQMVDMAWDMAMDAKKQFGSSEKLEILLGDILLYKQDFDTARTHYDEALNLNRESLPAQQRIAAIYLEQKKFEEARQILDKLADDNPNHLKVLEGAGLSNFETGNIKKAKKQMEKVQELDDSNKVAGAVAAQINIQEGNVSGVAHVLKQSHSEKEIVQLLNSAGIKMSKDDKIEEAIKIYKDCLDVIETKEFAGKVHYNLALAYQKLKDVTAAIGHLEKTLENIPTMDKASAMLAKLKKPAA